MTDESNDPIYGTRLSRLWSFGDGTYSNQDSPQHTYSHNGTYHVSLLVKDSYDQQSTATVDIVVGSILQNPIANFTYSTSTGQGVLSLFVDGSLSSSPNGTISSYAFDFGDGTSASGRTAQHIYQTPGTYPVKLTVTDIKGKSASILKSILIQDQQPPILTLTSPLLNEPVTIPNISIAGTSNESLSQASASIDNGSPIPLQLSSPPTSFSGLIPIVSNGSHTLTITATDPAGNRISQTYPFVENLPLPVAVIKITPESVKTGQAAAFSAVESTSSNGFITEVTWDFGDNSAASTIMTQHIYSAPGNYLVRLTVKDELGLSSTETRTVQVTNVQPPLAMYTYSIQTSGSLQLTVDATSSSSTDGYILSTLFDFGDGSSSPSAQNVHRYQSPGDYSVKLTVTDNLGQISTNSKVISIRDLSVPDLTILTPVDGSSILTPTFEVKAKAGKALGSAAVSVDGGPTQDLQVGGDTFSVEGMITLPASGLHTLTVSVKDSWGNTNFRSINFISGSAPIANISANPKSGKAPQTIYLSALNSLGTSNPITEYQWDFGDGSGGSGISQSHTYAVPGSYTVKLFVTDSSGVKSMTAQTIAISTEDPPIADFSISSQASAGVMTVTIDPSQSIPNTSPIVSYRIDFGDGTTTSWSSHARFAGRAAFAAFSDASANPEPVTHTYESPGNYTITLEVTDADGGVGSASQS